MLQRNADSCLGIELVRGDRASACFVDEAFVASWAELCDRCPWATFYQTPAFVLEWYRDYDDRFEPILLHAHSRDGQLAGILPLARSRHTGALVAAGAEHAEYQGWACEPALAAEFPRDAIERVRREFPTENLPFCYVPAGTPLAWIRVAECRRRAHLLAHRRPLLRFGDGSSVEGSLRKSGNKSRLRQLRKIGPVRFERVTDPTEFKPLLDEIARFHDCRQLAEFGRIPFHNDPHKECLLLALMRRPECVHVTALRVGDQIASAHLNAIRGKDVHLLLIAHNPRFARLSPGKLHVLFLARMLREEGYRQLDLTPGGEGYKERFANAADTVHTLMIYPTFAKQLVGSVRATVRDAVRRALVRRDIKPARLVYHVRRVKALGQRHHAHDVRESIARWVFSREKMVIYERPFHVPVAADAAEIVQRDCLDDLLAYHQRSGKASPQDFMIRAMKCLEEGHHVYTVVREGELRVVGWFTPDSAVDLLDRRSSPTSRTALLELETFAGACSDEVLATAEKAFDDAKQESAAQQVLVAVGARNVDASRVLLESGFRSRSAICQETRFGRTRRWMNDIAPVDVRCAEQPALSWK